VEWIVVVVILGFVWSIMWQKRRRMADPDRLPDPRKLLAAELQSEALQAEKEGRFEAAQIIRLRATWLGTQPPMGHDDPPDVLNPDNENHVRMADIVRGRYAARLADTQNPHAGCTFKPQALLPFPKDYIDKSLRFILALGRGDLKSVVVGPGAISDDDLAVLERSIQMLSTFIDVSPAELPTDPEENETYGKAHLGAP
jgi:hypothetical protein